MKHICIAWLFGIIIAIALTGCGGAAVTSSADLSASEPAQSVSTGAPEATPEPATGGNTVSSAAASTGEIQGEVSVTDKRILFQAFMGYFYGRARVTKQFKYDVLSLVVPILCHTAFDMFILSLMSIVGNANTLTGMTEAEITALPYYNYMIPMLVCAIVIAVAALVALILFLRKIGVWIRKGEKQ